MKACWIVGLCSAVLLSGCGVPVASPIVSRVGQNCEVQFRRDALGAAAANPVPPETNSYNGAMVSMNGTLKKSQSDSILLSAGESEYMIPTHAILFLKFAEAKK